jgi:cation:H+ antiporter
MEIYMILDLALVVVGLAILTYSGDRLIDVAVAVAHKARLTPAVIGLTILSAGTSAPELFVSATAALQGSADIAIANVVGSNIANVGLVLGVCAVIAAVPITRGLLLMEYPFMLLSSWILLLLCRDLLLDRLESGFFLVSLVAFLIYMIRQSREEVAAAEARNKTQSDPHEIAGLHRKPTWVLTLGLAATLTGLGIGARLLVVGASEVAADLGVSERIIGLTVVAIGTSLPELVASIAAALKRQHAMAVTNVVGSNIFNILLILGVTGLIRPIPVHPQFVLVDMWAMLVISVTLFPLVVRDATLSRGNGAVFLALYVGYLSYLALS